MRRLSEAERAREVRIIGEWDWWVLPTWNRLHAVAVYFYDADYDPVGDGITVCGRPGRLAIPGIFSRMGLPRCSNCCDRLGFPRGTGSPKNDKKCRGLARKRMRDLGLIRSRRKAVA